MCTNDGKCSNKIHIQLLNECVIFDIITGTLINKEK